MQVVIHAGAAFTDEGRILTSLQANMEALARNGVTVLGPRRYRQLFKSALDAPDTPPPAAETLGRLHETIPGGANAKRVILSCEDFIGDQQTAILEGQLYPFAGQRLAYVDQVFAGNEIDLFMGLANPGSFIPKALMSLEPQQRRSVIESTDLSCLNWLSMIEDIRDLAPNIRITLWSNEDTPFIWGDILRAMGGLPDDTVIQDEFALLSSLLTETGQREVLALIRQDNIQDKEARNTALARIFQNNAQPEMIEEELELPGWNEDIIDAFSELYEQDLAQIQNMLGIRFLKP